MKNKTEIIPALNDEPETAFPAENRYLVFMSDEELFEYWEVSENNNNKV